MRVKTAFFGTSCIENVTFGKFSMMRLPENNPHRSNFFIARHGIIKPVRAINAQLNRGIV